MKKMNARTLIALACLAMLALAGLAWAQEDESGQTPAAGDAADAPGTRLLNAARRDKPAVARARSHAVISRVHCTRALLPLSQSLRERYSHHDLEASRRAK